MKKIVSCIIPIMIIILVSCSNEKEKLREEIVLPYTNVNHIALEDNYLFFTADKSIMGSGSVDKLIKYDFKNKHEEVLYESSYTEAAMQETSVNNNWIVWVDSSLDGMNAKILAKDRKSNEVKVLDESNPEYLTVMSPKLSDDYVCWVKMEDEKNINIILFDLNNKKKTIVSSLNEFGLFNAFLSFDNNNIVWTDIVDDQGKYYIYNLESKKIESYPAPNKYAAYAIESNNRIYSINFSDFTNWESQSFGYFDISTGKFQNIKLDTPYLNGFDVFENEISIINSEQKLEKYKLNKDKLDKIKLDDQYNPLLINYDEDGNLLIKSEDEDLKPTLDILYAQ